MAWRSITSQFLGVCPFAPLICVYCLCTIECFWTPTPLFSLFLSLSLTLFCTPLNKQTNKHWIHPFASTTLDITHFTSLTLGQSFRNHPPLFFSSHFFTIIYYLLLVTHLPLLLVTLSSSSIFTCHFFVYQLVPASLFPHSHSFRPLSTSSLTTLSCLTSHVV